MAIFIDDLKERMCYLASPALQGREFRSEGNRKAAEYVCEKFQHYGLKAPEQFPDYLQQLPEGGQNVLGIIHGKDSELSEECIVIEAHHDHMGNGFIGASDNAAGIAVMLEVARIFASENVNKRSLLFACFDAEEQIVNVNGKQRIMYGASHYVQNPVFDLKKTIAMLTLDTLGRKELGELLFLLGSERSLFMQDAIYECSTDPRKIMFSVDMLTGVKGNYIPFIDRKVPSLFISNGIHRDYHTKEDTEDKIQYELLIKDVKFMVELVSKISNSVTKLDFCKNPICPNTECEDILYLLKLLQELVGKSNGNAEQFNYIINKLENKPKFKDLRQAVQIISGFMAPNLAKLYLLLNDAQMAEKRKEHSVALTRYREILELYDHYRVPNMWMQDIRDKITKLEERTR